MHSWEVTSEARLLQTHSHLPPFSIRCPAHLFRGPPWIIQPSLHFLLRKNCAHSFLLPHPTVTLDSSHHPLLAEQLVSIPTPSLTFGLLFTVLSPSRYGTARTLMTEQSLHVCVQECVSFGALGTLMRSYWIYLKTGEGAVNWIYLKNRRGRCWVA